MSEKTELSMDTPTGSRGECYVCRRAKRTCLCGGVKPFPTRMRFVILMHSKEAHKQRTGTARLAKLCLTNAELLTGISFTRDDRVNSLLRDPAYSPFVLYPGPKAVNFKSPVKDFLPDGKTLLVFVIDGTWRGARSLINKSQNIRALPRLSFSRPYVSQFTIKKQPREHCVSTIEAVYYLCKEAEEAGYEDLKAQNEILMDLFRKLVATQIKHQREKAGTKRVTQRCGEGRQDPLGG